jgi:hypothetical protein
VIPMGAALTAKRSAGAFASGQPASVGGGGPTKVATPSKSPKAATPPKKRNRKLSKKAAEAAGYTSKK